jgi:hypothetical protein
MLRRLLPLTLLLIVSIFVSACASRAQAVKLAPVSVLPEEMQKAPATVRTAYQFAVAHPDALENVPCYCGCGSIGHHSNLACYIQEGAEGAEIAFDQHALGCSICVDIATDVMKMTEQGKTPTEIRAKIVDVYSAFGPSNQ